MEDAVTKLTNLIVLSAYRKHATSITIEAPEPTLCVVQFVIDGVATEELRPPVRLREPIVGRFAALAGIDLGALPGDGVVQMQIGNHAALLLGVRITLRGGLPEAWIQLTRPDLKPRPLPS